MSNRFNKNTNKSIQEEDPLGNQYESQVSSLKQTVNTLKYISTEIGNELERQNKLLEKMSKGYHQGLDLAKSLINKLNELTNLANFSPMTMTILFFFAIIFFLWIYYKFFS